MTNIDRDIHELYMLNQCNENAFRKYNKFLEAYRSHHTQQFTNATVACNIIAADMVESINDVIRLLSIVLQTVIDTFRIRLLQLDKVQKWSDEAKAGFAEIQVWFDELAEIICNTRRLIHKMRNTNLHILCNGEIEKINDILKKLIESIVVVEDQPPEILKTDT